MIRYLGYFLFYWLLPSCYAAPFVAEEIYFDSPWNQSILYSSTTLQVYDSPEGLGQYILSKAPNTLGFKSNSGGTSSLMDLKKLATPDCIGIQVVRQINNSNTLVNFPIQQIGFIFSDFSIYYPITFKDLQEVLKSRSWYHPLRSTDSSSLWNALLKGMYQAEDVYCIDSKTYKKINTALPSVVLLQLYQPSVYTTAINIPPALYLSKKINLTATQNQSLYPLYLPARIWQAVIKKELTPLNKREWANQNRSSLSIVQVNPTFIHLVYTPTDQGLNPSAVQLEIVAPSGDTYPIYLSWSEVQRFLRQQSLYLYNPSNQNDSLALQRWMELRDFYSESSTLYQYNGRMIANYTRATQVKEINTNQYDTLVYSYYKESIEIENSSSLTFTSSSDIKNIYRQYYFYSNSKKFPIDHFTENVYQCIASDLLPLYKDPYLMEPYVRETALMNIHRLRYQLTGNRKTDSVLLHTIDLLDHRALEEMDSIEVYVHVTEYKGKLKYHIEKIGWVLPASWHPQDESIRWGYMKYSDWLQLKAQFPIIKKQHQQIQKTLKLPPDKRTSYFEVYELGAYF